MPLMTLTDDEIEKQFSMFHDTKSPLRAIAEAKRPNTADEFAAEHSAERFAEHSMEYVEMFGEAMDLLIASSQKASGRE